MTTPFWSAFALVCLAFWFAFRWAGTLPSPKNQDVTRVLALIGLVVCLIWAALSPAPIGWRP